MQTLSIVTMALAAVCFGGCDAQWGRSYRTRAIDVFVPQPCCRLSIPSHCLPPPGCPRSRTQNIWTFRNGGCGQRRILRGVLRSFTGQNVYTTYDECRSSCLGAGPFGMRGGFNQGYDVLDGGFRRGFVNSGFRGDPYYEPRFQGGFIDGPIYGAVSGYRSRGRRWD